jgi:type VI protein secretion system component VasF
MAKDPDALETTTAERESTAGTQQPAMEFAEGPTRAERLDPRARRATPLWPWLVIIVALLLAVLGYALSR